MFTWILSLVYQSTAPLGKMGVYSVDIIVVMSYTDPSNRLITPLVWFHAQHSCSDIMIYLVHTPIN